MNLNEATQHIGACLSLIPNTSYPKMKVVVLLHSGEDDISMVSNFMDHTSLFEVLVRGMSSCFDPKPKEDFKVACQQFLATIQPAVSSLHSGTEGVVCFWDGNSRNGAMISSLNDYSVSFAIICEHIYRVISGETQLHSVPPNTSIH